MGKIDVKSGREKQGTLHNAECLVFGGEGVEDVK